MFLNELITGKASRKTPQRYSVTKAFLLFRSTNSTSSGSSVAFFPQFFIKRQKFKTLYIFGYRMPELPEVETIVRQLKRHAVGKSILSAQVLEKKRADAAIEKVMPAVLLKAWRRAKAIVLELERKNYLL